MAPQAQFSDITADLEVMARDARRRRGDGPFVFAQVTNDVGVSEIAAVLLQSWKAATREPD